MLKKYFKYFIFIIIVISIIIFPAKYILPFVIDDYEDFSYKAIEGNIWNGYFSDSRINNKDIGNLYFRFHSLNIIDKSIIYNFKSSSQNLKFISDLEINSDRSIKIIFHQFKLNTEFLYRIDYIKSSLYLNDSFFLFKDNKCISVSGVIELEFFISLLSDRKKIELPLICINEKITSSGSGVIESIGYNIDISFDSLFEGLLRVEFNNFSEFDKIILNGLGVKLNKGKFIYLNKFSLK